MGKICYLYIYNILINVYKYIIFLLYYLLFLVEWVVMFEGGLMY